MPANVLASPQLGASRSSGRNTIARVAMRALALLVVLNLGFLAIRFADNLVPKAVVAEQMRAAYATGVLTVDSLPRNRMLGYDQGSDCNTMQMAVIGGTTAVADAIAPRVLVSPDALPDRRTPTVEVCEDLLRYLYGGYRSVPDFTYPRFWQGQASVLAAALVVMPVDGYRALLLELTLALIALAALLAMRAGGSLFASLAPLFVMAFLFDGQMSYGHLVSHGPAHVALWAFVVAMLWRAEAMTIERLCLLAMAAGATEAFLDQLISVPLVAGTFLIVAATLADRHSSTASPRVAAARFAMLATAWGFGFASTYLAKLAISVALLGPAALTTFVAQLAYRAGTIDPELGFGAERHVTRPQMLFDVAMLLIHDVWRLGYGDRRTAGLATFATTVTALVGWYLAVRTAVVRRVGARARVFAAGMPYIATAACFVLWVIALPEHTLRHGFMERSYMLVLIAGWGWWYSARQVAPARNTVAVPTGGALPLAA